MNETVREERFKTKTGFRWHLISARPVGLGKGPRVVSHCGVTFKDADVTISRGPWTDAERICARCTFGKNREFTRTTR